MASLQQQILALFAPYDEDVRRVVMEVLRFEQENIHLREPRYSKPILDIIEQVARTGDENP